MDRNNFLSILDNGNFDLLIGQVESDWLDCKREIYPMSNSDKEKRELAKDVSSFANTKDGGYILIGIKAEESDLTHTDTIKAIHPFPQNTINIEQYHNIIKDWIYPIPDICIEWKKYKETDKGIIVISIPPQSEVDKPFLIAKTIDNSGKLVERLFGYAERKRTNSEPKKLAELHQLFRDGLFYGANINNRFDEVTTFLQQLKLPTITPIQPLTKREISESEIWQKITDAIRGCELTGHRMLVLTAYTNEVTTLPTWIDSKSDIVKALENPPKLRHSGWDLDTDGDRSKIIRGELRRVVAEQYKIIDLYRDGTVIFAASAEGDFLAWGPHRNDLRINSLALIETIYNFTVLYELIINSLEPKPSEFFIRIDLHNMHLNGEKTYMVPCPTSAFSQHPYPSPSDEWNKTIKFEASNFNVSIIAYQIVQEIYLWFGMDTDMIPYFSEKNGHKIIDSEQIRNIRA